MKIKTITDDEILQLILDGRIVVKYRNRRNPVIYQNGKALTADLVYGSRSGTLPRYRVRIYKKRLRRSPKRGRKPIERTIVRSKIVWMFVHKRCVPYGHELHHLDEDRLNDRAKNIVDWTEQQHKEYHNGYEDVPF